MSKLFKPLMISALVASAVGNVQAGTDASWVVSEGLTQKSLEYGISGSANSGNVDFVGVNLSATVMFGDSYITTEIDRALSEGIMTGGRDGAIVSSDAVTVTWGCNCISSIQSLGLFVGYASMDTSIEIFDEFTDNGSDSGLFLGASYPLISLERGQLAATFAFASFDGRSVSSFISSGALVNARLTGSTTGLSYGIAWSGALSSNMNYSVSAKINNYSFDVNRIANSTESGAVNLKLDRIYTILGAKVSYFF